MVKQKNACCVYDFTTFDGHDVSFDEIKEQLNEWCKSWCFQQEKCSKTGRIHYQGRFSLKLKRYITTIEMNIGSYKLTSKANQGNMFYVMKKDSRVDGPWKDTDVVVYIPRQIREIENLFPWQSAVISKMKIWDTRTINCVINPKGNIGKSILVGWVRAYQLGRCLPPVNDYKDMLRMVCDLPTAKAYLIDMPKAIKKSKLGGFYAAIETIKDGYAYDDRYSFKEKVFDCPQIWIFTNKLPDLDLLSRDRWKLWTVDGSTLASGFSGGGKLL